jgi:hypothetical protein
VNIQADDEKPRWVRERRNVALMMAVGELTLFMVVILNGIEVLHPTPPIVQGMVLHGFAVIAAAVGATGVGQSFQLPAVIPARYLGDKATHSCRRMIQIALECC